MKDEKKLVGDQTKLDANKDGEITASDFEALRERTQKQMGGMMEGQPLPTEEEQMQSLMGEKTYSEEMQEELEPLPEKPEMNSDEEMEDSYLDEAKADERQPAQEGGLMEEDEYTMPVEEKPTEQVIRVTKETVGSQATMQEEDDLVGDELKKSMLSNRPYVRS
jgi:hypothetical protein